MSRIILPPGVVIAERDDGWQQIAGTVDDTDTFRHRGRQLLAIRGREMGRWHLSVSHRDRVPTWDELGFARDALLPPDAWLMVAHPPRAFWLNYDSRVLHLWEFRDDALIAHFMYEGELARAAGYNIPDSGDG